MITTKQAALFTHNSILYIHIDSHKIRHALKRQSVLLIYYMFLSGKYAIMLIHIKTILDYGNLSSLSD